ncbi:MAG: hypothetical protein Ta2A_06250 [Treponemataceae bacterium]|nr:MAG: hypothetical protein Ta2A_06250 [Treponemataceae bacterium]
MTRPLSRLERDIIISYLIESHVILNVIYRNKTNTLENIRLETGFDGVVVENTGFIRIKKNISNIEQVLGRSIAIVFYFRKLGLTFHSKLTREDDAFCFDIPANIFRLNEKQGEISKQVSADIYLNVTEGKKLALACIAKGKYQLFKCETWQNFGESNKALALTLLQQYSGITFKQIGRQLYDAVENTSRLLYLENGYLPKKNPFSIDTCILKHEWNEQVADIAEVINQMSTLTEKLYIPLDREQLLAGAVAGTPIVQKDIENMIAILALCNYLAAAEDFGAAQDNPALAAGSIGSAGPIENERPLTIAFISDAFFILGGAENTFPLEEGKEYAIQISCMMPIGRRNIFVTAFNSKIYRSEKNGKCAAVLTYSVLQTEDKRFLFEKLYGAVFS